MDLFHTDAALVVAVLTFVTTAIGRWYNAGQLVDADRAVADGIAGVVIYVMIILWYGLVVDKGVFDLWIAQSIGKLTISMAIIHIVLSRFAVLQRSWKNVGRCGTCGR